MRKRRHLSFGLIPRTVLESLKTKLQSRALRVYCVLTMYYSTEVDYQYETTSYKRPFIGHKRIANILGISKSQVKIDLKILSNTFDEDDVPLVIIHNRFNEMENRYNSNVYELPHVEAIITNFNSKYEF